MKKHSMRTGARDMTRLDVAAHAVPFSHSKPDIYVAAKPCMGAQAASAVVTFAAGSLATLIGVFWALRPATVEEEIKCTCNSVARALYPDSLERWRGRPRRPVIVSGV